MGVLWHEYDAQHRIFEILWSFSIWLEAVAILPQVAVMQADGQCENINSHYVFSLGAYRAFYILNWIYRKFTDGCANHPPLLWSYPPGRARSHLQSFACFVRQLLAPDRCRRWRAPDCAVLRLLLLLHHCEV
jgi:hypothetical protein